ncbi:MAG TPA: EthD domain-containing protein [Burkholderiales bacterium]|nr:EthD domain-containing protein [Burkholderiales bacterium]
MAYKAHYLARRNPATPAEGWPRLWRSHAAFAGQFGQIGGRFLSVMQCSRVLDKDFPGASTGYDGVAVLAYQTREDAQMQLPPDIRVKIDADELRVFDGYVANFFMNSREHVVQDKGFDRARGRAALISFLRGTPGVSRETLTRAWCDRHAGDIPGVVRAVVNEIDGNAPPGYECDAVAELWFPSADEALASFAHSSRRAELDKQMDAVRLPNPVQMFTYVTHSWSAPTAG